MTCIHCDKEIKTYCEKYESFGLDGDFIHVDCKDEHIKKFDKIMDMDDKEFYEYMGAPYEEDYT